MLVENSNTTLVKVKLIAGGVAGSMPMNSNTTLVKVKCSSVKFCSNFVSIQIQHLLKLNARKINLYDFHYTIKSIDIQGF